MSTDSQTAGVPLCRSEDLVECGQAWMFEVQRGRETLSAFALRFDGQVVAYLNRCAHVPAEMDWQVGQFLDAEQRYIICAIHGATYEPLTGECVAGPCVRGRLQALRVSEEGGQVTWYPSHDIKALDFN